MVAKNVYRCTLPAMHDAHMPCDLEFTDQGVFDLHKHYHAEYDRAAAKKKEESTVSDIVAAPSTTLPTAKIEVVSSLPQTRRFLSVFDEHLCAQGLMMQTICDRFPDATKPHNHYTVMQMELEPDSDNIKTCSVTRGLHAKEIEAIVKQMGDNGVHVYLPSTLDTRMESRGERLTLSREKAGQGISFFVDVRSADNKIALPLQSFPDSDQGYKDATRYVQAEASKRSRPFVDTYRAEILGDKKVTIPPYHVDKDATA